MYVLVQARDREPCYRCVEFSSFLAKISVLWKY